MDHDDILQRLESLNKKTLALRWKRLKQELDFQQEMFLFLLTN